MLDGDDDERTSGTNESRVPVLDGDDDECTSGINESRVPVLYINVEKIKLLSFILLLKLLILMSKYYIEGYLAAGNHWAAS